MSISIGLGIALGNRTAGEAAPSITFTADPIISQSDSDPQGTATLSSDATSDDPGFAIVSREWVLDSTDVQSDGNPYTKTTTGPAYTLRQRHVYSATGLPNKTVWSNTLNVDALAVDIAASISGSAVEGGNLTGTEAVFNAINTFTVANLWEVSDDGSTGWTSTGDTDTTSPTLVEDKYYRFVSTGTSTGGVAVSTTAASDQVAANIAAVLVQTGFDDPTDTLTFTTTKTGDGRWATSLTSETPVADGAGGWTGTTLETGTFSITTSPQDFSASLTATTGSGGDSRKMSVYQWNNPSSSNVLSNTFTVNASGPTVTYLTEVLEDSLTGKGPYSSGSVTIPAGDYLILTGHANTGNVEEVAVTLGGTSATIVSSSKVANNNTAQTAVYLVTIASGTTGTLDIQLTTESFRTGYARAYSVSSGATLSYATNTTTALNNAGATLALDINTAVDDILLAIGMSGHDNSDAGDVFTWAGLTEDSEFSGFAPKRIGRASATVTTAETPRSVDLIVSTVPIGHTATTLVKIS